MPPYLFLLIKKFTQKIINIKQISINKNERPL